MTIVSTDGVLKSERGHVIEPKNVRVGVSGLHPRTADSCLTIEQVVRKEYSKVIAQWDDINDEYKRWFIRQCRRYGLAPTEVRS